MSTRTDWECNGTCFVIYRPVCDLQTFVTWDLLQWDVGVWQPLLLPAMLLRYKAGYQCPSLGDHWLPCHCCAPLILTDCQQTKLSAVAATVLSTRVRSLYIFIHEYFFVCNILFSFWGQVVVKIWFFLNIWKEFATATWCVTRAFTVN